MLPVEMKEWHKLETTGAEQRPTALNDPFCYEPHPLCRKAAEAVQAHVRALPAWADEVGAGKMFGVLVCENQTGQLGFLAAYSGQILGRSDWPWFVPAVFDYLQSDGYFKQEEAHITAINRRIAELESADNLLSARRRLEQLRAQAEREIEAFRALMRQAKARRDEARQQFSELSADGKPTPTDVLTRESQHQKAELRRMKQHWRDVVAQAEAPLKAMETDITALRRERHERSDALQRWLFDRFRMLNADGEQRSLTDIFAPTPQRVPPAGSGECCAPKLLQFAFAHGLRPLQIAEFWMGRSPKMEIRHDGQFYTACRGKCKPILEWMLGETHADRSAVSGVKTFRVVYADDAIIVVDKPSGLLSVPGRTAAISLEDQLRAHFGLVYMVHRLDMDTSGLMVVARTMTAYHHLQRQFLQHTVHKEYVALLDGTVTASGTIPLPLRPDLTDRPRQLVDPVHGKEAVTDYAPIAQRPDGRTLIRLTPHTGRTHQLRVHCAHADGLATPIVGDALYGHPASSRLCLHAAELCFIHPSTGQKLQFTSTTDEF